MLWSPEAVFWRPGAVLWSSEAVWRSGALEPQSVVWSPKALLWSPEALLWSPKALLWSPRALLWSPKALLWNPKALLWPQAEGRWTQAAGRRPKASFFHRKTPWFIGKHPCLPENTFLTALGGSWRKFTNAHYLLSKTFIFHSPELFLMSPKIYILDHSECMKTTVLSTSGSKARKPLNQVSWGWFCRLLEPRLESHQIELPWAGFLDVWS